MSKQAQPSNSRSTADEQHSVAVIDADAPEQASASADRDAVKKDQKRHLADYDRKTLVELLRQMLLIRRFEEKSAEAYSMGKIGGFCHLYIGQEAVAVGAISAIRKDDYVLTS